MKTYPIERCPACGDSASTKVMLGSHALRRCVGCSLVYAPEYADPSEVYVDGYLVGGTDFGLDVTHPAFQEFLAYAAEVRMDLIERATGVKGSLLDVGCGTGEVLAVAQRRGWKVAGADPVEQSAVFAREQRGLDVRPTTLEESGFPEGSFDVVSAFHVVEHMIDALSLLKTMSRWARPGGYVVVEVPNWSSMHRVSHGQGWNGLRPLEHLGHYSPSTMRATMRRAGLEPVVIRTPGFLWPKQTLYQQLDDLGLQRFFPRLRLLGKPGDYCGTVELMARPGSFALLRALQRAYDLAGVGQVVLGVAQVPRPDVGDHRRKLLSMFRPAGVRSR
jgi:SAM-dependent methyltransferase